MAFEKYTAPPPPPPPEKPHVKFTRSIIQITDAGFDTIKSFTDVTLVEHIKEVKKK